MVSSMLGGVPGRAAPWSAKPQIYSTTRRARSTTGLAAFTKPGAVEIATTGQRNGTMFGLQGGPDFNDAKIGVSTSGATPYAILDDMNQQGR